MRTSCARGIVAFVPGAAMLHAGVERDASGRHWLLKSGSIELRLGDQNDAVALL